MLLVFLKGITSEDVHQNWMDSRSVRGLLVKLITGIILLSPFLLVISIYMGFCGFMWIFNKDLYASILFSQTFTLRNSLH